MMIFKHKDKHNKILNNPKKAIPVILSISLIVPSVLMFANAERLPEQFYEDNEGWNDENKEYAWFAYEYTNYEVLGTFMANESYDGFELYNGYYGAGSSDMAQMMYDALASYPTPKNQSEAAMLSYNGFSRYSFIPVMMAVAKASSSSYCENGGVLGVGDYRVINFSAMGKTCPVNETGLSLEEINYERIKYLYESIINACYSFEKNNNCKVDLNYCSPALIRVIESLYSGVESKEISTNHTKALEKDIKKFKNQTVYRLDDTKLKSLNQVMTKTDINQTSNAYQKYVKDNFPNANYVIHLANGTYNGEYTVYAICPANTNKATHNIIDTGSLFFFGNGIDEGDYLLSDDPSSDEE